MNQNPYQPPRTVTSHSTLTYYQLVTTKLRVGECYRISKNWSEWTVFVGLKLLHIRLPVPFVMADFRHFQRVSPEDLTLRARAMIRPIADQALALNLRYAFSFRQATIGTTELATAVFLSDDNGSVLQIECARTWTKMAVAEKTVFAFMSRLADGRSLVTHGGKGELDAPPEVLLETYVGKSMREVFLRHRERLDNAGSGIVKPNTHMEAEQMVREHEHAYFAHAVDRGVLTPVSQVTIERLRRAAVASPQPPPFAVTTLRLQGFEIFCWITLALAVTMLSDNQAANASQSLFRTSILLVAGFGIAAIWAFRFVMWMRGKADEHH